MNATAVMKIYFVGLLLLAVSVTVGFSGVAGFLTQERQDWNFIQSVGGMKVSAKEKVLHVECNVSGLRKVTVEPTMVNSGMGVRKLKHQRVGNVIQLSLITSVLEKGKSSDCSPIDLSAYPDGTYSVQYLDSDGKEHQLGKVTLKEDSGK